MKKIRWRKVWKEFQTWWNEKTVGPTDWPRQKRKIQRLVERELR